MKRLLSTLILSLLLISASYQVFANEKDRGDYVIEPGELQRVEYGEGDGKYEILVDSLKFISEPMPSDPYIMYTPVMTYTRKGNIIYSVTNSISYKQEHSNAVELSQTTSVTDSLSIGYSDLEVSADITTEFKSKTAELFGESIEIKIEENKTYQFPDESDIPDGTAFIRFAEGLLPRHYEAKIKVFNDIITPHYEEIEYIEEIVTTVYDENGYGDEYLEGYLIEFTSGGSVELTPEEYENALTNGTISENNTMYLLGYDTEEQEEVITAEFLKYEITSIRQYLDKDGNNLNNEREMYILNPASGNNGTSEYVFSVEGDTGFATKVISAKWLSGPKNYDTMLCREHIRSFESDCNGEHYYLKNTTTKGKYHEINISETETTTLTNNIGVEYEFSDITIAFGEKVRSQLSKTVTARTKDSTYSSVSEKSSVTVPENTPYNTDLVIYSLGLIPDYYETTTLVMHKKLRKITSMETIYDEDDSGYGSGNMYCEIIFQDGEIRQYSIDEVQELRDSGTIIDTHYWFDKTFDSNSSKEYLAGSIVRFSPIINCIFTYDKCEIINYTNTFIDSDLDKSKLKGIIEKAYSEGSVVSKKNEKSETKQ